MPKIKHTIIKWARENTGYSLEEAAYKLGLKDTKTSNAAEKLAVYEDGIKEPSRSLLIRMSKRYHQPLLTFYLDHPPRIGDRGEDFRTLPEQFSELENTYVDILIRDTKARQSTIRESLIDAEEDIHLEFIGKHTLDSDIQSVVQTLRTVIGISLNEYRGQRNQKDAFKLLRHHTEIAGVFVLLQGNLGTHHSDIDVKIFRGFALSDDIAPFIIINDHDAVSAWSFTLLHELAHLALGKTGVSGTYGEQKVEKFCNRVASEFLLPDEEFKHFSITSTDFEYLCSEISEYASSLKVSSAHIAYRAFRRGDISKQTWEQLSTFYRNKWIEERKRFKEKNAKKQGGPNPYVVKHYKLGELVNLVQRLTHSGSLTTTKAGMLLNIRPLKVHRLFEAGKTA